MTNEEILKFQKRARYVASKRGYPELADDFSQSVLLLFVERPDRHSTLDQLFIDYLRETYGDSRTISGSKRSFAERNAVSGEEENLYHDYIGDVERSSDTGPTQRECACLFMGREAEIYQAYFVDERTEWSIAQDLAVTESRVSQVLKPMKNEIRDFYILREGLERMEWDEDYTKLAVDWIKL